MWNFINYAGAVTKVLLDKSCDYLYPDSSDDDSELSNNSIVPVGRGAMESDRICPKSNYYDVYTVCLGPPTLIIDNIYLGSAFNAANLQTLKDHKVSVILNATYEISDYFPGQFAYLRYKLYDNNKHSIRKYLQKAYDDILYHQGVSPDKYIMVHCFMGASRSASIVLYYLMRKHEMTFNSALDWLRERRPIVNPTHQFSSDLAESMRLPEVVKQVQE